MSCSYCGAENPEGTDPCLEGGTPLSASEESTVLVPPPGLSPRRTSEPRSESRAAFLWGIAVLALLVSLVAATLFVTGEQSESLSGERKAYTFLTYVYVGLYACGTIGGLAGIAVSYYSPHERRGQSLNLLLASLAVIVLCVSFALTILQLIISEDTSWNQDARQRALEILPLLGEGFFGAGLICGLAGIATLFRGKTARVTTALVACAALVVFVLAVVSAILTLGEYLEDVSTRNTLGFFLSYVLSAGIFQGGILIGLACFLSLGPRQGLRSTQEARENLKGDSFILWDEEEELEERSTKQQRRESEGGPPEEPA